MCDMTHPYRDVSYDKTRHVAAVKYHTHTHSHTHSLSLSLFPYLSYTHTHTHIHAHIHMLPEFLSISQHVEKIE